MIFQHTWQKILAGEKTQTRRLIKPKPDYVIIPGYREEYGKVESIHSAHLDNCRLPAEKRHRTITHFQVGSTYAVQPARTHPAIIYCPTHPCFRVDIIQPGDSHYQSAKDGSWNFRGQGYIQARIKIVSIRYEDVRDISPEDAQKEGFDSPLKFLETWVKMHDRTASFYGDNGNFHAYTGKGQGWRNFQSDGMLTHLRTRPAKYYQAWVLDFEVVK